MNINIKEIYENQIVVTISNSKIFEEWEVSTNPMIVRKKTRGNLLFNEGLILELVTSFYENKEREFEYTGESL